ncbi:MAG: hypothetical protein JXR96_17780 [Deltaproteobacteria bacterium]|nr:hypothetical protein [Deltaproteobacteria bacterium]
MRLCLILATVLVLVAGCGGGDDATCAGICPAVVAAGCANGPPTQADCVSGCEGMLQTECAAQLQAMLDCSAGKTFTCDADDAPVATGCESQNAALNTCLESL